MRNPPLDNALAALQKAGANDGLPNAETVQGAKNGAEWSGKKGNGDPWALVKNRSDSYNATF